MALAYQDHVNAQAVARRWRELVDDFPELTNLVETPTVHDIVTGWRIIQIAIQKGQDIAEVTERVMVVVSSVESERFAVVISFAPYSKMTTPRLIIEAITGYASFSWGFVFEHFDV